MLKITFTPKFLEWVGQKMRANDTGLIAEEFAREFMHRAFVGRGAIVNKNALIAENERLRAALKRIRDTAKSWEGRKEAPYWNLGDIAAAALAKAEGEE